jgi:hypothetical protein
MFRTKEAYAAFLLIVILSVGLRVGAVLFEAIKVAMMQRQIETNKRTFFVLLNIFFSFVFGCCFFCER